MPILKTSSLRRSIRKALLTSVAVASAPAMAATSSYTSDLSSAVAGSWNRPFADGSCCSGLGPVKFNTQDLWVGADGSYTISVAQSGYDGYLFLYQNSFDPLDQTANFVAGDDDGNSGIGSSDIDAVNLIAGTRYIIVDTGFSAGEEGTYTTTVSGPGAIYFVTLPLTSADVVLGDLSISANKSLSRVLTDRLGSLRGSSLPPQHGFFLQSTYDENNIDSSDTQPGYNYRSNRITAGVDHKLTEALIVGAALSYEEGESDLDASGDQIDRTATSLSLFSSYQLTEQVHAQTILGYTRASYDLDTDARADTNADELSLLVGVGYHNQLGAVALDPFARVHYIYSDIDGYQYNDGDQVSAQRARSLRSMFGADTSMQIQTSFALLRPRASLAWEHEYSDEARHLYVDGTRLQTSDPDRDYFTVGLGLEANITETITAYVNYNTSVDATDDFSSAIAGFQMRF
tara:strand:- start:73493 stop:74872 length:1380 start_codon:yes stop_codon:yes gene_type:complete